MYIEIRKYEHVIFSYDMGSALKEHVSLISISTHRGAALMNSTEAFHLLRTWTKLLRAYKINMEAPT